MNTLLRSFQNQDTIAITSTTAMTINAISPSPLLVSDIAIFVLKRDVKLQLTNHHHCYYTVVSRSPITLLQENTIIMALKIFKKSQQLSGY